MEAHRSTDRWSLRLRFPNHEQFRSFADVCEEKGIGLTLRSIYNPHPPTEVGVLTTAQREALRAAVENGYFKVPRESSLSDLASALGIREQAMSQRLRRELDRFVTSSLSGPRKT